MRQTELERGFVLHRRDFSNTSLILETFTANHGRLPLLAKGIKGARGSRAALAALLQPFQPLWLAWSGRGEVPVLTGAEAAGTALPIHGDALYCGFYVNELLVRLLGRHDPHEALFVFYQQALGGLGGDGAGLDAVLRRFELRLLQELGYQFDPTRDADGAPIAADGHYRYEPDGGLRPAEAPAAGPGRSLGGAGGRAGGGAVPVSGATLVLLASEAALTGESAREARALLRALLAPHLGERPLQSRDLFRERLISRGVAHGVAGGGG